MNIHEANDRVTADELGIRQHRLGQAPVQFALEHEIAMPNSAFAAADRRIRVYGLPLTVKDIVNEISSDGSTNNRRLAGTQNVTVQFAEVDADGILSVRLVL